ncbi:hypothetical protein ACS0TY_018285 [Phlomoides rotata]
MDDNLKTPGILQSKACTGTQLHIALFRYPEGQMGNSSETNMAVDPYEDDVPDSFQDGVDGVDVDDVFIDQVESSQAWTTMRDSLAN